ncbi:GIY-YIG nuclease family protein [Patescibacteria group bacterium]|nr:GIY-YIG nuclease family protein [Patescibacteria group bacterium]
MNSLAKIVASLPHTPGVYIYKNSAGTIIYVGKAIDLKRRVSQYFQRDDALGPKTTSLVSEIADINFKTVGSEIEALVLEASLIKKFLPKYNSQLKDDKSYTYIVISSDKLPYIFAAKRSQFNPDQDTYYGPFPNGSAVRNILKTLRRIFPFYTRPNHPSTRCLYCHLGLCPGPNPNTRTYRHNIRRIKEVLSGKFLKLKNHLSRDLKHYSHTEQYEKAAVVRDQLRSLEYITAGWQHLDTLYQDIVITDDKVSSALDGLVTILQPYFPFLRSLYRLECFDISNFGAKFFVGAMTVFQGSGLDKAEYRKFKIRTKITPDDQFMVREVVFRRLKHYDWEYPQVIIVDGGKPQVSSVYEILKAFPESPLNRIGVVGLAKKEETIVIKNSSDWVEINLPKDSNSLKLLQQLRDEAHRFANSYRKELMKIGRL